MIRITSQLAEIILASPDAKNETIDGLYRPVLQFCLDAHWWASRFGVKKLS